MKVLLVIIPVAVIGGFIGSILNRKCNEKAIKVTFTIAVFSVAALSLYNAVMSLYNITEEHNEAKYYFLFQRSTEMGYC